MTQTRFSPLALVFARLRQAAAPLVVGALLIGGCKSPSKANIKLRKENQTLREQISLLERRAQGDAATIQALESHATTVPSLAYEQLRNLYTTHGIRIGRLTAGVDLDGATPGDEGLQAHVVPLDQTGDLLKAAGAVVVEAFDLSVESPRLGRWEFSPADAAPHWRGNALSYGYVLNCPWQTQPARPQVTVRITFTDTLTGRSFTEQKQITIAMPGPSAGP